MDDHTSKSRAQPGPKGAATKARLMEAAHAMLKECSPLDLTAVSVSRAAGFAPPSFYVYFADVRALMLALADDAAESLIAVADNFETEWPPAALEAWAADFVRDFIAAWRANAEVLSYRNLVADSGDAEFDESRVRSSLPILSALTDRMLAAWPADTAPRRVELFAEAVILYASMERLAAKSVLDQPDQLRPDHYIAAFARMIAKATRPHASSSVA